MRRHIPDCFNRHIILLSCLFNALLQSAGLQAQQHKIDSLQAAISKQPEDSNKVKSLNALAGEYLQSGADTTGLQYAETALALSEKIYYTAGKARAYINTGWAYSNRFDHAKSFDYFSKAAKAFEETGDIKGQVEAIYDMGNVYVDQDDYAPALKYFFQGLKVAETINGSEEIARGYTNIGGSYFNLQKYPESLKMYEQALQIYQQLEYKGGIAFCLNNIGELNFEMGNYTEALKNDSISYAIYTERKNIHGMAANLMSMSKVFFMQGQNYMAESKTSLSAQKFSTAITTCLRSLKMFEEIESDWGKVNCYITLGRIYMKQKNLIVARNWFEKCLRLSKTMGDKFEIRDSYLGLAALDSISGNHKQALVNYKLYISYRDSMNNQGTERQSLLYKIQYDEDKKELIAKAEMEKKEALQQRAKTRQNILIAVLVASAIVFLLLASVQYRHNKQKQKANALLGREKMKVENALSDLKSAQAQLIQSEKMASLGQLTAGIAHEIQNPLNFVNNFSEVNAELIEELKSERIKTNTERNEQLENELINDIAENEKKINHHGKRADDIVKSMLQHSQSSSGLKEPTDINALAEEYLRLAYNGFRAKEKFFSPDLKTQFDPAVKTINLVAQDIAKVLLNLYNNAFYTLNEKIKQKTDGYEPVLSVHTAWATDKVVVTVKDNGIGIPQKIVDKIFQPFFTTKPTGQGTGLGLSLSYDIVKAHGGDIAVVSEEGVETKFVVTLPVVS